MADDPTLRWARRAVLLRQADGDDDELLGPRVVYLERLAGSDVCAGVGLEVVCSALDDEGSPAGGDVEDLLR